MTLLGGSTCRSATVQALLTVSLAATLLGGCSSSVPASLGEALGLMPERPWGVVMQFVDVRETAEQLDLADDLGLEGLSGDELLERQSRLLGEHSRLGLALDRVSQFRGERPLWSIHHVQWAAGFVRTDRTPEPEMFYGPELGVYRLVDADAVDRLLETLGERDYDRTESADAVSFTPPGDADAMTTSLLEDEQLVVVGDVDEVLDVLAGDEEAMAADEDVDRVSSGVSAPSYAVVGSGADACVAAPYLDAAGELGTPDALYVAQRDVDAQTYIDVDAQTVVDARLTFVDDEAAELDAAARDTALSGFASEYFETPEVSVDGRVVRVEAALATDEDLAYPAVEAEAGALVGCGG